MSFKMNEKNLGYLNLNVENGKKVIGLVNINGQVINIFGIKNGSMLSVYNENGELLVDAQIVTSKKDSEVKYFEGEIFNIPVIIMKNRYQNYSNDPDLVILRSKKLNQIIDETNRKKDIDDLFE